ncbi:MAG: PKD domain-containing protein [Cytophagales bacterium]|nr:PKD domain-containing protein [Cytophagales bacterium]
MRFLKIIFITVKIKSSFFLLLNGQCPTADFMVQDTACISESLIIQNNSVNGINYEWDFCAGDFINPPHLSSITSINQARVPTAISLKKDQSEWIGFISSRDNNKLFRLEFGHDMNSVPIVIDLGDLNGFLNGPKNLELIKTENGWYGFLINFLNSHLLRLHFGNSLKDIPTVEDLGTFESFDKPRGLKIERDGEDYILIVSNYGSNSISILNFGNNVSNNPDLNSDIININSISGTNGIFGIDIDKACGKWFGLFTSFRNKKVFQLEFGNSLFSTPTISELATLTSSPTEIKIIVEGGRFYSLFPTDNGQLYKLDLGKMLNHSSPKLYNWGNFEGLSNIYGFDIVHDNSIWRAFGIDWSSRTLYRYSFETNCSIDNPIQFTTNPKQITYNASGKFFISLKVEGTAGDISTIADSIFIKTEVSPIISINSENFCITSENNFYCSDENNMSITSWSWNFGDGIGTSILRNPSYQYQNPGDYTVTLNVEAENGCTKFISKSISIYDPPVANFSHPSTIICSNDNINFANETSFNGPDSILSYEWNMNNEKVLNEKDADYTFSTGGDKSISLIASIPGCSSELTKTISIAPGPNTSFSFTGTCLYDEFSFTNTTTGDHITTYQWDFGDGYFSTLASPIHSFESGGNYIVSLTASNSYGCNNTLEQVVPVRFTPNLNFVNDLACSGKSVTLFDQSSVTDANISEHYWSLTNHQTGYSQSGSGPAPTFLLTEHGAYEAMLIGASNYGCLDTLTRNINVYQSPVADFTYKNTCFGDSSLFVPQAELAPETELLSTDWLIDGTLFSQKDVKYKFPNHGEYKVELYIRSSNLCSDNVSKVIAIHPLPDIDFVLNAFCEDQLVSVNAISDSQNDPVASFNWLINDKPVSDQESFQYEFQKSGDYNLSLNVTTQNNCFASLTKNIRINPGPTSNFDVFPSTGASPLNVQFTDRSKGAQQISYSFSRLNDDVSFEPDPTYTYYEIGSEIATQIVENEYGCTDTSTQLIDVVIPIYDVAINHVNVESMNDELTLLVGLQNNGTIVINNPVVKVILSDKIVLKHKLETNLMPEAYEEYEIDFDVITTPSKSLEYICFTINENLGSYEDINPGDNSQCINIDLGFNVLEPFPNPSSRLVNIPIVLSSGNDCDMRLIGEQGNIVYSKRFPNLSAGLNTIKMDLTPYRKGIYIAVVRVSDFEVTRKIVVQ